jgi:hypothetical protein
MDVKNLMVNNGRGRYECELRMRKMCMVVYDVQCNVTGKIIYRSVLLYRRHIRRAAIKTHTYISTVDGFFSNLSKTIFLRTSSVDVCTNSIHSSESAPSVFRDTLYHRTDVNVLTVYLMKTLRAEAF